MKQFKLICLDIDGTLLNSQHQISPSTKAIIQRVVNEKQAPVILVSARMPKGIRFLQRELNISQPIICYSGALVMDHETGILLNQTITLSQVQQAYDLARTVGAHMSLYGGDEWFIEESDEWAEQESAITNISPSIMKFRELLQRWGEENTGPNKILYMAEPGAIHRLERRLKGHFSDNLNIYPSKPTYLEIMPKNASKTSAIEFLCRRLAIHRSEIIAIGDNYNDLDMLKFAGLGIAMGNAPDPVKLSAAEVTLSNDEEGVAAAIQKYLPQISRP
jgi:Cof subfamily protein (haloacid dehalogenase superfamily)